MDDDIREATIGGYDYLCIADTAVEIDDQMTMTANADTLDDECEITDVCVNFAPLKLEESKKQEDTDFTVRTWKEDLTLIVENKKLFVSKAILGLVSPVFDRMFQSEFKEGHQTDIELPDKKLDDVKEFLRCIYPNMNNDVSERNVYTILPLADEYQVTGLKTKCEDVLKRILEKNSPVCDVYRILNVAAKYDIMQLTEEGLELAAKRSFEELECAEKVVPISAEIKSVIHKKVMQNLQRELDSTKNELQTMKTLNNFHRASLTKLEQLNTDDLSQWEGASVNFVLDLDGMVLKRRRSLSLAEVSESCEVTVNICGVLLQFMFKIVGYDQKLSVSIIPVDNYGAWKISLILKIVLLKARNHERNFYKILKEDISPRNKSKSWPLITLNEKESFSHFAKVDSEIHVLACKGHSWLYDHFSQGYQSTW